MAGFALNEIAFVVVLLFIVVLAQVAPRIGEAIALRGGAKPRPDAPKR